MLMLIWAAARVLAPARQITARTGTAIRRDNFITFLLADECLAQFTGTEGISNLFSLAGAL
jgi:hypothetical protein